MARHRLFDARRRRKSYTRVGPTGVLYTVLDARIWISPPGTAVIIPALFTNHDRPAL